jgi:hypothetical protein
MRNSLFIALIFCVFTALVAAMSVVAPPTTPQQSTYLAGSIKGR